MLRLPEFRLQVVFILVCLVVAMMAPLWRRWRVVWLAWAMAILSIAAVVVPIAQFLMIRPALDQVYGRPIVIGWGPGVMAIGFGLLAIDAVSLARNHARPPYPLAGPG
jgi:hypothetical protein